MQRLLAIPAVPKYHRCRALRDSTLPVSRFVPRARRRGALVTTSRSYGPIARCSYIAKGVAEGARLVCGGKRWAGAPDGYYIEPAVMADVTDDMTIAKEEIFGPVMCCMRYSSVGEAVRRANATDYGLAATVITNKLDAAITIANALETGTVWINGHGAFDPAAPYGGRKQSGIGREYGLEGILPYVETKTVWVMLPPPEDILGGK